jgi:hypothetical protein
MNYPITQSSNRQSIAHAAMAGSPNESLNLQSPIINGRDLES